MGGDGGGCKDLCEAVTFGALKRKGQSWRSGKRKDDLGRNRDMGGLEFIAKNHRK